MTTPVNTGIETSVILDAIRARLEAEVSGITVYPHVGAPMPSASLHKSAEVVPVSTSPPTAGRQREYLMVVREFSIRWRTSAVVSPSTSEGDALAFAAQIRTALCGKHTWAHTYQMTFAGEPVALERDGGYFIGEINTISRRAMPTGS